jgi:hypothetical protein
MDGQLIRPPEALTRFSSLFSCRGGDAPTWSVSLDVLLTLLVPS